jgi:hypothetical protein
MRESNKEEIRKPTKEEIKKFKQATAISENQLAEYKDFLRQSNTGIFRLLPDFDCETKKSVRFDGKCSGFIPGAWAYSFREEKYSNSDFHDIVLKDDLLTAGGFLTQAIFVSLGDIPLERISLDSKEIRFLADFTPAEEIETIKKQSKQIAGGFEVGSLKYSNSVKTQENTTYALRTIAYKYKDKLNSRFMKEEIKPEEIRFLELDNNKREDLILAFRIIKKDGDNSITIIWKELQKIKPPTITFQKDEKLSDIR